MSSINSIAVISDIHGNYPALKAVLTDIDCRSIGTIYCLGDLVGYYCMINEVIDEIRKRKIQATTGNHDYAMVRSDGVIPRSKTATGILKRQLDYITRPNFNYLSSLPGSLSFSAEGRKYYGVHGGLQNNIDEYVRDIDEQYFIKNDFAHDVLITGHTHLPVIKAFSSFTYLNPGSTGQPRDGDTRASYLTISGTGEFAIRRVAYDIDEIVQKMKAMDFESYIYEVLYRGKRIGA